MTNNIKHILRYGTNADQKYFSGDFESCYDMVAINANMIASSPDALALFVGKQTINKPFFVDPITHLFQHSQSYISGANGNIKKSIDNLISKYAIGIISEDANTQDKYDLLKKEIKKTKLEDNFVSKFAKNVLDYQENLINGKKNPGDYKKYVAFAKAEDPLMADLEIHQDPDFLVAPYFYIDEYLWVDKNIELIEISKKVSNKKIYAQIVLSKRLFERSYLSGEGNQFEEMIKKYKETSSDGFLVWLDGYSEHEQVSSSLNEYSKFLKELKTQGKPVYLLYGGYFSICLINAISVNAVSHGLEYGESREVVPVGGGIPTAKFYFLPLHKRMILKDMLALIIDLKINSKEDFFEKICDCPTCKESIGSDVLKDFQSTYGITKPSTFKRGKTLVTMSFSTTETKSKSLKHYLYNKRKEFEQVSKENLKQIIDKVNNDIEAYKSFVSLDNYQHLLEWEESLKNISSNSEQETAK